MSIAASLYGRLPTWAQHAMVTAYGAYWHRLRFGAGYEEFVRQYRARERFTAEEWREWQNRALRRVLTIAATHVPFYRERWTPAQCAAAMEGELASLPLLEKDSIRANPRAFVNSRSRSFPTFVFHTSGTTGTPVKTIWKASEIRDSLAVREVRSAGWAGVSFGMPRATFSGRLVEPDPQSRGPFHRYNAVERQTYLSAFHLAPSTAAQYVEVLRKNNVRWMTGYAVSFYLLARYILDQRLDVPPLSALVTTSEKLTAEMRHVMEEAYQCRVFEEYSTVENSLFASECEKGKLHVSPDVGVVEILRGDGTPCDPRETGEVVATCLMRHHQPFIRYRLGDLAAWDDAGCTCGRTMPVIKEIVGRLEDVVVGPDGREMVRFHGIFVAQPHVREGQIVQETVDRIVARVVPSNGFSNFDADDIVQRIRQRLGPQVTVNVETVERIPRSAAGKYKAVISLVGRNGHHPVAGSE